MFKPARFLITLIFVTMTSQGVAYVALSSDHPVTSYGSSLQLDCLALRSARITSETLELGQPTKSEERHERNGLGFDNMEKDWLPGVSPDMQFVHWILPDLRTADDNSSLGRDVSLVAGQDGSITLQINFVRPEHLGDYICHALNRSSSSQAVYSRSSLRFESPPIWEEYRYNFITALIASGSTLVVTTLLCIVHSLRWRPVVKDEHDSVHDDDDETDVKRPHSIMIDRSAVPDANNSVTTLSNITQSNRVSQPQNSISSEEMSKGTKSGIKEERRGRSNEGFTVNEGSTSM